MSPAEKSKVRAAALRTRSVRLDGEIDGRFWGERSYVSDESCGAGGAGEEVEPLFGLSGSLLAKSERNEKVVRSVAYIWVPVQFSQRSGLEGHDG